MKIVHVYDVETKAYKEDKIFYPRYEDVVNEEGEVTEVKAVYEGIPENSTELSLPQPNWKPVWDGEKWVETITEEELEEMNKPQPHKPSEIEKLNALITEMKAKHETLEEENAGLVLSSIKKEMTLELMQEEQSTLVLNLIKGGVL